MDEEAFFSRVKKSCIDNPQTILLPESHDERVVKAAEELERKGLVNPVLIHRENDPAPETPVTCVAATPTPEEVQFLVQKRKHKRLTEEEAREKLKDPVWYAMARAATGGGDGVVCGASHSSATTYKKALTVLPRQEGELVSSFFLLFWEDKSFIFTDCALNINPSSEQLAKIAEDTAETAKHYGLQPRVAFLSYSTDGSAGGKSAKKVREAVQKTSLSKDIFYGETQFDAAFLPSVREKKHAEFPYEESANIYVFPDLASANIAYKVAERLGGAVAVGPITQGLHKPVNDLSRGSTVHDIIDTILLTAYHE